MADNSTPAQLPTKDQELLSPIQENSTGTNSVPGTTAASDSKVNREMQEVANELLRLGVAKKNSRSTEEDTVMDDFVDIEEDGEVELTDEQVIELMGQERKTLAREMRKYYTKTNFRTEKESEMCYELAEKIKRLTVTMSSYAAALKPEVPVLKGAMASKYAPATTNHGALSLSRKDLPKCYVEGKPSRQFAVRERSRILRNSSRLLKS